MSVVQVVDPVTFGLSPLKGVRGGVQLSKPANAIAVTPDDAHVFDPPISVWVGVTGDVALVPYGRAGDAVVTYPAVPAGAELPVLAKKVMSTGTTAGQIRGQW